MAKKIVGTQYSYKVAQKHSSGALRVVRSGFTDRDSARWYISTKGGRAAGFTIIQVKTEAKEIR